MTVAMLDRVPLRSHEEFEVTLPDDRGAKQKAYDRAYATFSWCSELVSKMVRGCSGGRAPLPMSKIDPRSKHLYVFIHGLDGSHLTWSVYLKQLAFNSPHANYLNYPVPKRGNCGLKEASESLIARIDSYIREFPHTEFICLIGKSNGARIAARTERKLSHLTQSIHTVSISGIHQGTGTCMMPCIQRLFRFHPKVIRDLTYRSEHSLELLDKWRNSLQVAKGPRSHAFYISSEDEAVVPPESGLVQIGPHDQHFVFHGYTHRKLADGICLRVLANCHQGEIV